MVRSLIRSQATPTNSVLVVFSQNFWRALRVFFMWDAPVEKGVPSVFETGKIYELH